MAIQAAVIILLLKTPLSVPASAAEGTWHIAVPQNPVTWTPFRFRQGINAENLHGLFIHIDQFTGLYVRNVHDFVDVVKKPPYVTHPAALRIFM